MLHGDELPLADALVEAGFVQGSPAAILVNAEVSPGLAAITDRCVAFANDRAAGQETLIITLLHRKRAGLEDWQARATAAALASFTRDAALTWGPRHIRVNAIETGSGVPLADLVATMALMAELPSMTGQLVRLGVG